MGNDEVIKVGYREYKFPEWNGYSSITKENVKALGRLFESKDSAVRCYAEQCMKATYLENMLLWIQAKCETSEDGKIFLCLNSARELFNIMIVSCESMKEFDEKVSVNEGEKDNGE